MPPRFNFAISFAGADREIAREIKDKLRFEGFSVFFDEDYEHELIGRDASVYLRNVYSRQSTFCIVLISRQYDLRQWTQLERESIQARELTGDTGVLIPVRLEDYAPEWLPATRIYFDLTARPVEKLISVLKRKVSDFERAEDFEGCDIAAAEKENFIRTVCQTVKNNPVGDASWATRLFPEEIASLIGETTPLPSLVDRARAMNRLDACFDKTVQGLKRDWDRFAPPTKRAFIDAIRKNRLTAVFSGLLFLTSEEEAYLRISWTLADVRYSQAKAAAYEGCKSIGIDLQNHNVKLRYHLGRTLSDTFNVLGELLRNHVSIDVEQVLAGAGRMESSYSRDVAGRVQSAYLDILEDLRQSMANHGFDGLSAERLLDPFKDQAEAIRTSAIVPGLVG